MGTVLPMDGHRGVPATRQTPRSPRYPQLINWKGPKVVRVLGTGKFLLGALERNHHIQLMSVPSNA